MKRYTTFPKSSTLEPWHQMVYCHIQDTCWWGGSDPFAEMQTAYSTTPADWVVLFQGETFSSLPHLQILPRKTLS